MSTVAEKLALAAHYHQAGALQQAEQVCLEILRDSPAHADALHRLGILAFQRGDHSAAIAHIRSALQAKPDDANYYSNLALPFQTLQQWDKAEACLAEAIRLKPDFAAAHFNLGNVCKTQGKLHEAAASYQQALQLQADFAPAHHNLANVLAELNRLDEAIAHYQKAIACNPRHAFAYNNLGTAVKKQGKLEEAAASFRQALAIKPDLDQAHNNLGSVFCEQGRHEEALQCFQEALRCHPEFPEAFLNLAALFRARGDIEQAIASYHRVLQLRPNHVEAYKRLGDIWQDKGQFKEAIACYRLALTGEPDCFTTYNNLGNVLRKQGKWAGAASCYEQALRIKPDCVAAHYNMGGLYADQSNLDTAVASYQEALRLQPDFADAHSALGAVLNDQGKMEAAIASWNEAMRLAPNPRLSIAQATRLPIIYQSVAEIEHWRERLIREVKLLRERQVTLDLTEHPVLTLFYLAYHGRNDRDIHRDVAGLFRAPPSDATLLSRRARRSGKIRVGFLSCHFTTHTIGQLNRGLVANLSRDAFEVTVLSIGNHVNDVADFFRQHSDSYVEVSRHLPTARRIVAEQELDVLFFADIGMDSLASTLAHSRLAPVQCATWGHPVTTGIPTIDYFISSVDAESEACEEHYTEKLVRLQNLAVHYYKPSLPGPLKDRSKFGFGAEEHIYACPQSLFKLHPEFDEILGGILRSDANAVVILMEGKYPHWDELLNKRFAVTLADVRNRVRFVKFLDRPDFINLQAVADVLLDPLHFVGGNTSYEAFAYGTPTVTLPSAFLRGRLTYALYKQMGVMDCVARSTEEYLKIALRLGMDRDYRSGMRQKILDANGILFENNAGVRELEGFLKQAVFSVPEA